MAAKNLSSSIEALSKIRDGINKTANVVRSTLGPGGRTVIIGKHSPDITKDGVKVAKAITLEDAEENIGCQFVKDVASATVEAAGDGTTTATVLFQAVFEKAFSLYKAGVSPIGLKEGMKFGTARVIEYLREHAQHISSDSQRIREVATISANGDEVVGDLIAKMIADVGADGIITVEDGKSTETTSEKVEGMKFDQGFKAKEFVNNPQKQVCELENVHILIHDKKIESHHIGKLVEVVESIKAEPLLVIAEDIEGQALLFLIANVLRAGLKFAAVKLPGFGDTRSALGEDIAVFTGATYLSENSGNTLDNYQPSYLGRASKVIIDSKATTIISSAGNRAVIDERCEMLKNMAEQEKSDYMRGKLEDRISKLKAKAGIIYVGGTTEAEQKELKDRVDDALQAVKAATIGGILAGGGSAYLRASVMLDKLIREARKTGSYMLNGKKTACSEAFAWGMQVIMDALYAPLRQSLANAGLADESQIILKDIIDNPSTEYGYDVRNEKACNMLEAGIVDPAECSIAALSNAAHTAAILISSDALITDKPETNGSKSSMGGMDY